MSRAALKKPHVEASGLQCSSMFNYHPLPEATGNVVWLHDFFFSIMSIFLMIPLVAPQC